MDFRSLLLVAWPSESVRGAIVEGVSIQLCKRTQSFNLRGILLTVPSSCGTPFGLTRIGPCPWFVVSDLTSESRDLRSAMVL